MFSSFKKAMQENFTLLLAKSQRTLYLTDVNKELMWETYLDSFPQELRQEYNCNCCKSFIRHYGGMVAIINSKMVSIWNFPCDAPFDKVTKALNNLIQQSRIINVFYNTFPGLGTDSNVVMNEDRSTVRWEHMFFKLPKEMVSGKSESIDTLMGKARDNRNVFKRGLEEISLDAVDTVLELIAQNSLYRGADYKGMLDAFKKLKVEFDSLSPVDKDNWAWHFASQNAGAVAKIKNIAIGTLLVDISEGRDLDEAVSAFERIMAPTNYKRPNAVITKKMIEQAEKTITELGYGTSLGRRFATVDDLTVNNLLFVNRDTKKSMGGLLDELKETAVINPKGMARVEEITVENFLNNILPRSKNVEVLFENKHINNLVSLITAKDMKANSLFKWNNNFSWSYKNAVADSLKEKVKAAGGKIEGELRISLEWYNFDDLDLHVQEPGGQHIYFSNKISPTGGHLDVDMNAGGGTTRTPVENIIWPSPVKMKEGKYKAYVHQFASRETIDIGFSAEIECQGQLFNFNYNKKVKQGDIITIAEFEYSKKNGFKLLTSLEHNEKVTSKNVWGVDTNRFQNVSMILKSPNMWDGNIGNEHLIFVMDQAHNDDDQVRGFFNEFLKEELVIHKRVFEALGSRMKVDPAQKQVSGLGFSTTQHNDLIVKVDGSFSRTLKIKF